jgi:hypothetical protein
MFHVAKNEGVRFLPPRNVAYLFFTACAGVKVNWVQGKKVQQFAMIRDSRDAVQEDKKKDAICVILIRRRGWCKLAQASFARQ